MDLLNKQAQIVGWLNGKPVFSVSGGHDVFELTQASFRARNDDGSETGATWKFGANVNWTQAVDENFRVRFLVQETGAGTLSGTFGGQLQYNLAAAGWNNVTASSSVVQAVASSNITDGVATTQQMGAGTFVAGSIDEVDGNVANVSLSGDDETEVEYVLTIVSGDVTDAQTLQLRVIGLGDDTTALTAYTNTPTVTVSAVTSVTLDVPLTNIGFTAPAPTQDIDVVLTVPLTAIGFTTYTVNVAASQVSYLSLPGEINDYASAPDSAALSITGDIDIRLDLAMDDWSPTGTQEFVSKYSTGDNQRAYRFLILPGGSILIQWSTNGSVDSTSLISSVNLSSFANGSRHQIRVAFDVDNGSSQHEANFYTKDTGDLSSSTGWTQLGTTQTGSGTTSIFDSSEQLSIGQRSGVEFLVGKVYRTQIFNGIAGTLVFDANFDEQPSGTTSFKEASSNAATVTINQSGSPQAEILTADVVNQIVPITAIGLTAPVPDVVVTAGDINLSVPLTNIGFTAPTPTQTIDAVLTVPLTNIGLTAPVPTQTIDVVETVPVTNVGFTAPVPTVLLNVSATVPLTNIGLTTYAPTVTLGLTLDVPVTNIGFTAPTPTQTIDVNLSVPVTNIGFTAPIPTVVTSADLNLDVPLTAIGFTAPVPTQTVDVNLSVPLTSIGFTALTPTSDIDVVLEVPATSIGFTALTPSVVTTVNLAVPVSNLGFTAPVPTVSIDAVNLEVPLTGLGITLLVPVTVTSVGLNVPVLNLGFTGIAPDIVVTNPAASLPGILRMRILEDGRGRLLEDGCNRLLEGMDAVTNLVNTSESTATITAATKVSKVSGSDSGKKVTGSDTKRKIGNG